MIKDYLKSPEYFCRKYILKEVDRELTASLKVGSMVDAILSGEPRPFQIKVLKEENPTLYAIQKSWPSEKLISKGDAEKAEAMAKAVTRCKFWTPGLNTKKLMQVILESAFENMQLCGKPDIIEVVEGESEVTIRIIDIKTSQAMKMKNARAWHWTCEEYGYYLQLTMYRKLVLDNTHLFVEGEKKIKLEFGFIAVSIDTDGVVRVCLFSVPEWALGPYEATIYDTLRLIKAQKFTDPEPTWETAICLFPDDTSKLVEMEPAAEDEESEEITA